MKKYCYKIFIFSVKVITKVKFSKKFKDKSLFLTFTYTNYKPFPVDLNSRYSLQLSKKYIANRINKLQNIDTSTIYRQPNVYRWIDKIEALLNYKSNIEPLWRV